jgi:hypothetical protein
MLEKKPSQNCFEHIPTIEDNFNWQSLTNLLRLPEKIGLKLTCHPAKNDDKIKLFEAILEAVTPIAIWTRINVEQVSEIDQILHNHNLGNLDEIVRKTRLKAQTENANHLGHHLALLWDNPHRLPPDIMYQLVPLEY